MRSKDVLYDGVVLDEPTVERLLSLAKENGIDIPVETTPEIVHFTLHYFGQGDREGQMTGAEIGTPVQLEVKEIGILSVDGDVQNIGFRLDEQGLSGQAVGERTLGDLSVNEIPHITISVQGDGEARNTQACFEQIDITDKKGQPIEETRIERTVIPVSDVRIEGVTAAFMEYDAERSKGFVETVTRVETEEFDDKKMDTLEKFLKGEIDHKEAEAEGGFKIEQKGTGEFAGKVFSVTSTPVRTITLPVKGELVITLESRENKPDSTENRNTTREITVDGTSGRILRYEESTIQPGDSRETVRGVEFKGKVPFDRVAPGLSDGKFDARTVTAEKTEWHKVENDDRNDVSNDDDKMENDKPADDEWEDPVE